MKDLSPRLLARALPLVLAPIMSAFIACEPDRSAAPPAELETTPAAVDPDDADAIPCGPRRVLQAICQQCHQNPPVNGAPFPLVTRTNIVRVGPDGEIRDLMIQQIEVGRMPLSPVTIDYNSREILLDWLHAGAPAEPSHSCDDEAAPEDAGSEANEPNEPNELTEPPPRGGEDDDGATDADTSPDAAASD